MKLARFEYFNTTRWGIVSDGRITLIEGDIFGQYTLTKTKVAIEEVRLLAPCQPSKAVCIGLNYHDHAREMKLALPERPLIFLKPSSSLAHPESYIEYPSLTKELHYEAELAVIIGKQTKNVSVEQAYESVFGYTCANDVTARDLQRLDGQWTRSKSFDTFMPLGPWIETDIDPHNINIRLLLNDEIKQKSNTSNLIFKIPELISFVSKIMTLLPGDVILTGTPSGVGPMKVGDIVTVELEGIGRLTNKVTQSV